LRLHFLCCGAACGAPLPVLVLLVVSLSLRTSAVSGSISSACACASCGSIYLSYRRDAGMLRMPLAHINWVLPTALQSIFSDSTDFHH
jgi:hypothetical protein